MVDISLDSNFYLFEVKNDLVVIQEVFTKASYLTLSSKIWGIWTRNTGLIYNEAFVYQRRKDLTGVNIRIGALPYDPVTKLTLIKGTNHTYLQDGIYGDIWKALQRVLNFSTTVYQEPNGLWSKFNNDGTWEGLSGMLQRKEVDFITNMAITKDRARYFDSSLPCLYQSYVEILVIAYCLYHMIAACMHINRWYFYIHPPKNGFNWLAFFAPFSIGIWISFLATILILPLSIVLLNRWNKNDNDQTCNKENKIENCGKIFFEMFSLIVQQGKININTRE